MASEETSIEVSDFEFHALRKVRLTSTALKGDTSRRLAISSSYGIGIAIVAANRLLAFHTADVHAQKADRTNINEEVTGVRTRTTSYFDEKASLVAVSCNCDGTLVGALADTAAGPMVHIFDAAAFSLDYQGHISPLTTVRVSAEPGATARCFEWSPAAADTLIAAASDRSLVTVAVKAESASYTMVGEKKMGAPVRAMSWSRKGKQLVVGDDLGKVVQMKPELDIVRSTMPPATCTIVSPAVVGLCWMTTTEFLVVYGSQAAKDVQATIMITKKDKPITWTELADLAYGSPHSTLSPAVTSLCLLEWNALLTTNTKSSEVSMVGKAGEVWQVWVPDELHQASLPTNAATAETFPIGAELDFSASEQVVLSDDHQTRVAASPILFVLTSDGLLMGYHAVNLNQGAPSMQVPRKAVNPAAVRVGARPEGTGGQTVAAAAAAAAPAATPAAATAQKSLFGTPTPAAPAAAATAQKSLFGATPAAPAATPPAAAQKSLFGAAPAAAAPTAATPPAAAQKSLFGGAAPAASAAAAAQAETAQLLQQLAATPVCAPNTKPAGTPAAAGSLFGAAPAPPADPAAAAAAAAATAAATAAADAAAKAEKAEKQRQLVEDKKKVNALLQEVQNEATALVDEMARMREIAAATRPTMVEMERELKVEDSKKLHDMDKYVKELEEEERRNERILKAATIRISDRLRMVEEAGEGAGALATMRKDYDYDREESMAQLQRRVAAARTTLAEVQKELARMREGQQTPQAYKSDAKWTSDRVERVNGTIKNIQKIIKLEREKVEDVEALARNVVQLRMSDDEVRKEKQGMERAAKHEDLKVIVVKKPQPAPSSRAKQMTPAEEAEARRRLVDAKTLFPFPAPRRFMPEQQQAKPATKTLNESTLHKSTLNHSLSSTGHPTVVVNSPLRAQLEERLLEVTKPRKAIQLPSLEKFAIKQESRPAALRDPPSPIVSAAPAAKQPVSLFGGATAAGAAKPAFRLPEPQAASTPKASAAAAAPAAATANLFGTTAPPTAAAAAAKDKEKAKDGEKAEAEPAAAAAAAAPTKPTTTTPSIFGGATTTPAAEAVPSPLFDKLSATAAASAAATATTPAAPPAEQDKAKDEKKADEAAAKPVFSFGGAAAAATTAAAPAAGAADQPAATKPATSSIFGGGAATDASKPATSSIFGGGVTSDASKPSTSSIFGAGATAAAAADASKPTTSSIFGGGATTAAAAADAAKPASIFGGGATAAAPAAAPVTPIKSIFGTIPSSAPFGAAAAAGSSTPKSIFGGAVAAAASPSSPFGAAAAAAAASPPAATTSSIFGGGVAQQQQQQTTSPFGSAFGKPAAPSASSFSFKSAAAAASGETQQQQATSGFGQQPSSIFGGGAAPATTGGFGQPTATSSAFGAPAAAPSAFGSVFGGGAAAKQPAASSFAAAAAAAAADEGMDDGGSGGGTTSAFGGGGFMGGLGSSTSANAGRNVFGGGFGAGTTTNTQASSIFGKPSTTTFGAKPAFGGGTSAFGAASPQQTTSAFGASSSPSTTTGAFGKPAFGSGPSFGAKSIFGGGTASPQQQQQPAASSAFGGGAAGGGFAAFANQGGGFGSVAAQSQQQQTGASSIFGGGVGQSQTSSIFGGGTTAGTTNKFSSWR